jgi:hypothetical protein
VVRYGRTCPEGFLPIFSVETEDEAERLLTAACKRGRDGDFIAPELVHNQTLENLYSFGDRLRGIYGKACE